MKKIISTILAIAMITSMFAGCGPAKSGSETESSAAASGETIKIAVAGPLTGDNAEYGNGFKNAVELMVNKYNAEGGVLGKKIEVVAYDDKNTGEEAATIAQKIVSDDKIVGVIGHFASGVCMAASPTYQENGMIEISPSASHPDYTKEGEYIFRNNTVISVEAGVAVKLAVEQLKKTKIGILSIKTDWGTATSKIVKDIIAKDFTSAQVVAHEEVVEGSDDYSPNITKLKNAGAEVIICVSMYNTLAPFTKQYKQVDPNIQIVGFSNAYSQQLIKLGGEAVEGVVFPIIFFHESSDAKIKSFVDEYTAKYGNPPSSLTAQAYDSAGILLEAIKKAGSTDRKAVRDQVAKIEYDGVTGMTKFNGGDAMKEFKTAKVEGGKFVEIK